MTLFRDELLHGSAIALAGGVPIAVRDLLGELGAGLATFPDQAAKEQAQAVDRVGAPRDHYDGDRVRCGNQRK
ncbi:MAG: hypothetical protein WBP81_18420 [Solirubrobacteraceae bacterium]